MPLTGSASPELQSLSGYSDLEASRYLCDAYHQLQGELWMAGRPAYYAD